MPTTKQSDSGKDPPSQEQSNPKSPTKKKCLKVVKHFFINLKNSITKSKKDCTKACCKDIMEEMIEETINDVIDNI
jgi:hypothetical protein